MTACWTGCDAVLRQWHTLDASRADSSGLEHDVEPAELRMRREPTGGRGMDATDLLRVDHLERVAERRTALLLHLDDDHGSSAPKHEIELVAANASIGREEPVSAESVVAKGAPLAPIHAAS